jgi:hypothetical protein
LTNHHSFILKKEGDKNTLYVKKSGVFSYLGYSLWANFCPRKAHDYNNEILKY